MHFNIAPHFEVRRLLEGGAYSDLSVSVVRRLLEGSI